MIRPEDFGAAGDGRADDTHAIQAALDHAGEAAVVLSGRSYAVSATILVPSGASLQGFGTIIKSRADDAPLLASKAWAEAGAPIRGRTRIAGLRIEATGRGARQDGIVLHDFWSLVEDCEIVGPGGRGIVLTAVNRAGMPVGSTLVENRIRRCIVRDSGGSAFWLGEPANGKLTDGELSGCIASLRDGAVAPAVVIGHAAGWAIRDVHTYGGRPSTAIEIRQGYFTRVAGLYVEGFGAIGLALPQIQTSVAVSDVQIAVEHAAAGSAFIAVSGHGDYPTPLAQFSNVSLTAAHPGEGEVLRNEDGRVRVEGDPVMAGPAPPPRPAASAAPAPGDGTSRRVLTWTGRAPQTIVVSTVAGGAGFAQSFLLTLAGRSSDGALTTLFAGMVTWVRASADARAILVDLVPFGSPYGFQSLPRASFEPRDDGFALSLAFTPIASGPGQITIG